MQIKADAMSFGWQSHFGRGGRPVVDETERPSVGDGITRLLVDDSQARVGRLLWNRLSAVTHVTWWGLQWALELPADHAGKSRFVPVAVGTDSATVATQAFCILRALRVSGTERFTLMGWNDAEWQTACRQAETHERALFEVARQIT